jgi:hypothetical protein
MSDVKIQNVGGPNGVASEATLLALVRVLSNNGQNSAAARLQQRAQRDLTRETSSAADEQGKLKTAVKGLSREFLTGGDRISDFTDHILKSNGVLQSLIRYGDGLVDQFRTLSSVGASFNNSIFDMRDTAFRAGMSIESFQDLVMNNSETLRLFGSSVTDGTKRFTQLSRQFRNLNPQFFDMGFSIEDINNGLIGYADLLLRTGRVEKINSNEMLAGSKSYMKQLDLLAKATGQSREAMAKQAEEVTSDARIRAFIAQSGNEELAKMAVTVSALAPGFKETFLNLSTFGVASDEMSQLLISSGGAAEEFANLMLNASNMDEGELMKELVRLGPMASKQINEQFSPAVIAAHDGLRALQNGLAPLAGLTQAQYDAMLKEQAQQEKITSAFAGFSQAIQELRSFIYEKIIDSEAFKAFGNLGNKIKELISPSKSGSVPKLQGTLTRFINALTGENGVITKAIDWITGLITDDSFSEKMTNFVDTVYKLTNQIIDFLLGEADIEGNRSEGFISSIMTTIEGWFDGNNDGKTMVQRIIDQITDLILGEADVEGNRSGGIISSIAAKVEGWFDTDNGKTMVQKITDKFLEGWDTFWKGPTGTAMINTVTDLFERLLDNLLIALADIIPGYDAVAARTRQLVRAIENNVELTEEQEALRRDLLADASDDIKVASTRMSRTEYALNEDPNEMGITAARNAYYEYDKMLRDATALQNSLTPKIPEQQIETSSATGISAEPDAAEITRKIGTLKATGMKAEPKDAVAKIHAGERVLNPQETQEYNSQSGSQRTVVEKLDQLNNTMMAIASLMSQELAIQTRTMNNISGLGSDLMKGMP